MLREEKGITLVALIITIIVLIILAAVTIIAVKESNMTNIAVNGTQNYAQAQVDESNKLEDSYLMLSKTVENLQSIQAGMQTGN